MTSAIVPCAVLYEHLLVGVDGAAAGDRRHREEARLHGAALGKAARNAELGAALAHAAGLADGECERIAVQIERAQLGQAGGVGRGAGAQLGKRRAADQRAPPLPVVAAAVVAAVGADGRLAAGEGGVAHHAASARTTIGAARSAVRAATAGEQRAGRVAVGLARAGVAGIARALEDLAGLVQRSFHFTALRGAGDGGAGHTLIGARAGVAAVIGGKGIAHGVALSPVGAGSGSASALGASRVAARAAGAAVAAVGRRKSLPDRMALSIDHARSRTAVAATTATAVDTGAVGARDAAVCRARAAVAAVGRGERFVEGVRLPVLFAQAHVAHHGVDAGGKRRGAHEGHCGPLQQGVGTVFHGIFLRWRQ